MVVIAGINSLELTPVTGTEVPELQGFFIKARKDLPRKKTGFLLNAVRQLELFHRPSRTRTIIKWLSDTVMEIEEYHGTVKRHRGPVSFHVRSGDSSYRVMKGKPVIIKNVFKGKIVSID